MSETRSGSGELARAALQLVALGALIATALWVLRPFLGPGLWAVMLVIATWPLLLRAQALFGGRRSLAVALLTSVLLLALLLPLYFGVQAIVNNADDVARWSHSLSGFSIPRPPAWLEQVPLVGARAASEWNALAEQGPDKLSEWLTPHARDLTRWLVQELGGLGTMLLSFLITTVLAALLYAQGETAAEGARRFARRLADDQGEKILWLAGQAVRAVALGVVVTAVVQTTLVGIGLLLIGVPFVSVLTALCFVLSVAQIGPLPVLIGVTIWAYTQLGVGWGTAFVIWALPCATVDNILRPVLIRRGADLPLLLIFGGVIGGLIAFGVIGLFVGPVVLAVGYTLLSDWTSEAARTTG